MEKDRILQPFRAVLGLKKKRKMKCNRCGLISQHIRIDQEQKVQAMRTHTHEFKRRPFHFGGQMMYTKYKERYYLSTSGVYKCPRCGKCVKILENRKSTSKRTAENLKTSERI